MELLRETRFVNPSSVANAQVFSSEKYHHTTKRTLAYKNIDHYFCPLHYWFWFLQIQTCSLWTCFVTGFFLLKSVERTWSKATFSSCSGLKAAVGEPLIAPLWKQRCTCFIPLSMKILVTNQLCCICKGKLGHKEILLMLNYMGFISCVQQPLTRILCLLSYPFSEFCIIIYYVYIAQVGLH